LIGGLHDFEFYAGTRRIIDIGAQRVDLDKLGVEKVGEMRKRSEEMA
jgi:hypothetical protein